MSIGAPQPGTLATLKRHGQPRIGGHDLTGHRNTPSENKKGSPRTALRKKQGRDYSENALEGKKNVIVRGDLHSTFGLQFSMGS
jgi:hypothetical protein